MIHNTIFLIVYIIVSDRHVGERRQLDHIYCYCQIIFLSLIFFLHHVLLWNTTDITIIILNSSLNLLP